MNRTVVSLLLLLFSFHSHTAYSHNVTIHGRVLDADNKPLSFANVILLTQDNKLIKTDYTDEKGEYRLTDITNGSYELKVMLMGYETYDLKQLTAEENNTSLPDINLKLKANTLNEVSVRGQKPLLEVKPDMIVVNVANSIINAGTSVMDVLSKSPGVSVDQNDNIALKGKQGVNIMINGKLQPVTGSNLANILKSMPSDAVKKIELISNPSAKYDAEGTAGIINIVLKKDQHMGMNGTAKIGYGQGVYPKEYATVNINYRNKRINLYANYNYSNRKGFNHLQLIRHFYDNGTYAGAYQQDHYAAMPFQFHNMSAGADYDISKKTTVGMAINGFINTYKINNNIRSNSLNAVYTDRIDSFFITKNYADNNWYNYGINLNLNHNFDTPGKKITVNADYARYWNNNTQNLISYYYHTDGVQSQIPYKLYGDVTGLTQLRSFNADFTNPMKRSMKLEAGIKTSFVTADNAPLFYDMSTEVAVYDSGKSNHYIYNENINAAYVTMSKELPKWGFQLGLRAEQTNVKGEQKITGEVNDTSYIQLFPSIAVQRHINKNNDLGLSLSRRIERPNYEQLNPFKYYADPTTTLEGDPYLQPALTYAVELSHTYKGRFITTLSYSVTNNVMTEVLLPAPNRITIQTTRNIAIMRYYGISCAYPFNITKWWQNVTNLNLYYSYYEGNLANSNLSNGKPTGDINSNNSFLLPKNWSGELGIVYNAPMVYGFMNLKSTWGMHAGVQKNLWDKKASVLLNVTDIFRSMGPAGTSYYNNYDETFTVQRETRVVNVSFVYHFGKNTVAPVRRHSGSAEEEKQRMGNGI